jgi:hypothetical protein
VAGVYAGNDASAYRAKPCNGCARVSGDVTTGRIDAAGAWHHGRLLQPGLRGQAASAPVL